MNDMAEPEFLQSLLAHLTPIERRVIERVVRGQPLREFIGGLMIDERRCRELYRSAVEFLRELVADARV